MHGYMKRRENIVFGAAAGRSLRCDILAPVTPSDHRAAVLMIHGGSWIRGDKSVMEPQAEYLVKLGYVCVCLEYRFITEAAWPAQIHDAKAGLRWLRSNATSLDVDPSRIAVLGNSAGAYLALMLAATPGMQQFEGECGSPGIATDVAACIAFYPPVSFYTDIRTSGSVPAGSLMGKGATTAMAAEASVTTYARKDFPPTFLQHGTGDKVVPVTASLRMYEALAKARARVDIHLYADQPHGWARTPEWLPHTMAEAALFLDRYVAHPSSWLATGR